VLNYRVWSTKSVKGVSVKTLEMYALTFLVRLLSILRHQGYLPFDKTGDWFYHFVEIVSLLSVCLALYGVFGPLCSTYDGKYDRFGNLQIPAEFGIAYLVVPCVLLAVVFHP
jgi:ER lumen protein retaining receptor